MANVKPTLDQAAASSPHSESLIFVNVSNPAAVDSQNIRRLVRSSATRHSHRDPTRKPKSRRTGRAKDNTSTRSRRSPTKTISTLENRADSLSDAETDSSRQDSEQVPLGLFGSDNRVYIAGLLEPDRLQDDLRRLLLPDEHIVPPNSAYPVDAEEWFPWVFSYYRTTYLPRGIQLLQQSEREGEWFVDWFLREGLRDPALFYVQLLSACAPLLGQGRIPEDHIFWLRGMVVRTINEAIGDTTRVLAVGTFLAVALIALHETLYGDKALATQVHARAFAQMIAMAGGIEHLIMPRLAWKILLWIDELLLLKGGHVEPITKELLHAWAPELLQKEEQTDVTPDVGS